jgi:hypothetical protein
MQVMSHSYLDGFWRKLTFIKRALADGAQRLICHTSFYASAKGREKVVAVRQSLVFPTTPQASLTRDGRREVGSLRGTLLYVENSSDLSSGHNRSASRSCHTLLKKS